jgi:hypothetical protein
MTIFEFIRQFHYENDILKLQEVFSDHGIRVFLENGLESFQAYLILQIRDTPEMLKRFQKQIFRKIPCCIFTEPLNWGKYKNRFELSARSL